MGREGSGSKGRIDGKELTVMFIVLLLTIGFLGFFFGWVYNDTPAYLNAWGIDFAWHSVAPYMGTAMLGFIMLLLGIKAKKS